MNSKPRAILGVVRCATLAGCARLAAWLLLLCFAFHPLRAASEKDFRDPPAKSRAWMLYFFGDAQSFVTREGLTRDLESMKAQGIGGVLFFYGWLFREPGKGASFYQNEPGWREMVAHALREARRLGLPVVFYNSPVWNSGGPWVKAEDAMKEYTWSRLETEGPGEREFDLPALPAREGFSSDAFVVAYPTPGQGRISRQFVARPRIRISPRSSEPPARRPMALPAQPEPLISLTDGNFLTALTLVPDEAGQYIEYGFGSPFECEAMRLQIDGVTGPVDFELQVAGAEGGPWKTHHRFSAGKAGESLEPLCENFAPVASPYFRLMIKPRRAGPVHVAELEFLHRGEMAAGDSFIPFLRAKTASRSPLFPNAFAAKASDVPAAWAINGDRVINLTGAVDGDGRLRWKVPPGKWTILRFGYTLTGIRSVPAWAVSHVGDGYEVDRFDRAALERHFNSFAGKFLDDPALQNAIVGIEEDSWEAWLQNWSAGFPAEFQSRTGYEITRWLPVLAGEVVDGAGASERFLGDFRRTIGDLIADNFYGAYRDLCRHRGIEFYAQAFGPGQRVAPPGDVLKCKGRTDVPMGEFHTSSDLRRIKSPDLKEASSAAHLYGKPLAAAEAFTGLDNFRVDPFAIKALGDRAFCAGINRFHLHLFLHKPDESKPGSTFATLWGTGFHRHQTWWPMANAYFDYLARCQHMLQRGRFVADFLYFYGEDVPTFAWGREKDAASTLTPPPPEGYDFDWCNGEIIMTRLSVRDGQLVTPEGLTYRALLLPERRSMTPALLRKIEELVNAGATVIGPRPETASSPPEAGAADAEIRSLAGRLWGAPSPEKFVTRRYGRGRIIAVRSMQDITLREILKKDGIPPDFEHAGASAGSELLFIHRVDGSEDIYFISNQSDKSEKVDATFRVAGGSPQLWDPVTGGIRGLPESSKTSDGRTRVPLTLAPRQSFFVVFGNGTVPSSGGANFPPSEPLEEIQGPWEVTFDPALGGPGQVVFDSLKDWTEMPEEGIRHYSGIATYRKKFDLKTPLSGRQVRLDLGLLKNVARVRLNGKDLGVVWTAPWQIELGDSLKPQGNELEIEVANLWINRLQLDRNRPEAERIARTNAASRTLGDDKLLPAGLLGPVTIQRLP